MAFWFGRKSVPERHPFVPAWLTGDGASTGFARGIEGARVLDRVSGQLVLRRGGSWENGIVRAQEYRVAGVTVVRQQQAAIADPTSGSVIDVQCRATVSAILAMLRTHGLIA
jgi:hypothetical protein